MCLESKLNTSVTKNSPDHESRRQQVEDTVDWLVSRAQLLWEYIAPHPVIETHPGLTLLGVITLALYWILGTPIADLVNFFSRLATAGEVIWAWVLPDVVQSIFLEHPVIHLIAFLFAIGVVLHVRNHGISHIFTEELVPLVEGVFSGIERAFDVASGAIAKRVVENRDVIRDVVINVVSSWIFWVLVALGIVGASFNGLLDVLGALPLP